MPREHLVCDGCGQPADPAHITRRLKRLENMTRYRPIHVQVLFLGAASPLDDLDYLYSAEGDFRGEGLALVRALGMEPAGKAVEAVLTDFQRRGYLLTHLLDCPRQSDDPGALLEARRTAILARIRRSLKPKKLVLLGGELDALTTSLGPELPGVELVRFAPGRALRLGELAAGALAVSLGAAAAPSMC
jgi:hypothetical protein